MTRRSRRFINELVEVDSYSWICGRRFVYADNRDFKLHSRSVSCRLNRRCRLPAWGGEPMARALRARPFAEFSVGDLERNQAIEARIARSAYVAHAARAYRRKDFVRMERVNLGVSSVLFRAQRFDQRVGSASYRSPGKYRAKRARSPCCRREKDLSPATPAVFRLVATVHFSA